MCGAPLLPPKAFTARDCAVWFEGREVTPAKAALIKFHLTRAESRTEDGATRWFINTLRLQLTSASVAAVNQRRQALRLLPRSTDNPPLDAA